MVDVYITFLFGHLHREAGKEKGVDNKYVRLLAMGFSLFIGLTNVILTFVLRAIARYNK